MKEVATMEELQKEKFTIFLSDEPGVKTYQSMAEKVHAEKTIGFRCDSVFTIISMISASHLIGYVPGPLRKLSLPYGMPADLLRSQQRVACHAAQSRNCALASII